MPSGTPELGEFIHSPKVVLASWLRLGRSLTKAMPSDNIEDFRRVLSAAKQILVVSGAGLSAASGIPTFRGAGGMWRKYDAISLATPQAFAENQSRVWQFYHYRRELVLKAVPNPAHYVLARLALPSIRQKVAPNSQLTHVTQNIDGLLTRALEEMKASYGTSEPPSEIIEMHGRLFDVVCTAHDCSYRETNYQSPICPALAGTELIVEGGTTDPIVQRADLPHCPLCGQLCRPGVVWFGEQPYRIHDIFNLANKADLCIVVGTSALVQPASHLGGIVRANGGQVAVFNIEAPNHTEEADFLFLGPCEERLGQVLNV